MVGIAYIAEGNVGALVRPVGLNGYGLGGNAQNAKAAACLLFTIFVIGSTQSESECEISRAMSMDPLKCPLRQRLSLW